MANPASVGVGTDYAPAIILTATTESSVILDPSKVYQIWHLGVDGSGTGDTSNIMLSQTDTVDADDSAAADKLKLEDGVGFLVTIGPGWSVLYFESYTTDPTFQIVPLSSHFGRY